jgi:rhodanese-related sulfurtransferase
MFFLNGGYMMKLYKEVNKKLNRSAVIVLVTLMSSAGFVQAENTMSQPDSAFLTSWQSTFDSLRDAKPKWGKQSVEAFKASMDAGVPMVMLDVRTPKEWKEGIIKDALLINLNELPKTENLAKLPEDRSALMGVYCSAGHRSALALAMLNQMGYKNVILMEGGTGAWIKASYPLVKNP